MKKLLIFALFFSTIVFGQTFDPLGYKWFKGIQNKGSVLSDDFTQVVVRDPVTGLYGHVLKSSLGGSTTIPTLQQVINAGNIANISQVSGVYAFQVTSPNTVMGFSGETIFTSNNLKQAEYGLNGFIHKLNDNTQRAKLSYDGLELKTNVTGGVATIKSDNLSIPVTIQLPTTSGTLALTGTFVDLTSTQTNIAGTKAFTSQTFFNNGVAIGDATNNFTITYAPANGLTWREQNIPRMTLADRVLILGNYTSGVNSRLDISNITANRTHFLPDKNGTIALTSDTTGLVRVPTATSIPAPSSYGGGVILLVEDTKKMYRNDGTKWQGL